MSSSWFRPTNTGLSIYFYCKWGLQGHLRHQVSFSSAKPITMKCAMNMCTVTQQQTGENNAANRPMCANSLHGPDLSPLSSAGVAPGF